MLTCHYSKPAVCIVQWPHGGLIQSETCSQIIRKENVSFISTDDLSFIGAFAKLRKAIISCAMSVRPSVRPSARLEQLGSHCTDFHEIWYLSIFQNYVENFQVSLTSDKNKGYFTWRPINIFWSFLAQFFLEWEMLHKKKSCRENHNTFYVPWFFTRKSCRLIDNVEWYCRAGRATDDNMVQSHCMLDN